MWLKDKTRLGPFALLAAALILGGTLRFFRLGSAELTPDEAASWAAAAAPTAAEVVRLQAKLNPGKLAVHDLALHAWIGIFGAGVTAMRALSALLGTLQIVLVFWVAREILLLGRRGQVPSTPDQEAAVDYPAAIGALIFAVNLAAIKYAREARMYAVLMVMMLLQVGFLIRARTREGWLNYLAVALFTMLSVAANFTAVFMIMTEGLWLLLTVNARRERVFWKLLGAVALGIAGFIAITGAALHIGVATLENGTLNFIPYPHLRDLVAFFNYGTLSYTLIVALAVWGIVAGWSAGRAAIVFALLWMWGPVILLYIVSLTVTPLLVTRYALSSFVPFLILAALGIWYCGTARAQAAALSLVIALAAIQFASYIHRSPPMEWRRSVERIRAYSPSAVIAVAPVRGANLIRYYLSGADGYRVVGLTDRASCAGSGILVVWNGGIYGPFRKQADDCSSAFPRVVYRDRDFQVLAR